MGSYQSAPAKPAVAVYPATSQSGYAFLEAMLPHADKFHIVAVVRSHERIAEIRARFSNTDAQRAIECRVCDDADDEGKIAQALACVQGAFLVTPHHPDRGRMTQCMIRAARVAKVIDIVVAGSWTAAHPHPRFDLDFGSVERAAAEVYPHHAAVLRSGFFMSNFLASANSVKARSTIYTPMRDQRMAVVDPDDIGHTAAALLRNPPPVSTGYAEELHVVNVSGPESFSYADFGALLSAIIGKPIEVVNVSFEQAAQGMKGAGVPDYEIEFVEALLPHVLDGTARIETPYPDVEALTGRRSTLHSWLQRNKAAFLA